MKKILVVFLCVGMLFSLTSCSYYEREKQEITLMFDSFDKSENNIFLTCFELVVNETHYNLDDITYNDQKCNIVFLEKNGLWASV